MASATVALVLAPASASELQAFPAGTPAWVACTPEMQATLAAATAAGLRVTKLSPNGDTPLAWLANHLDSVDQHHNEFSQTPPYTTLAVLGLSLSQSVEPILREFGFVSAAPSASGFTASKLQGTFAQPAAGPE